MTRDTPIALFAGIATLLLLATGLAPVAAADGSAAIQVGGELAKVLDGEDGYDQAPYVEDGTVQVMLAGPDHAPAPADADDREDLVAYYDQAHAPYLEDARELADAHDLEIVASVPTANHVFVKGSVEDVEEIADEGPDVDIPDTKMALDFDGALETTDVETAKDGSGNYRARQMANVGVFHDEGYLGEDVLLSHIDTGADPNHPCFLDENGDSRIVDWKDIAGSSSSPHDNGYHGTHTLASAAGSSCEEPGVAPAADLMVIGTFDGGASFSDVESALQYAYNNGADVGTNSWGSGPGCDSTSEQELANLVNNMVDDGFDLIFSAGNSGSSGIGCPADAAKITSIGATDFNKNIASFSSRGPCSDGKICPDVSAVGENLRSADSGGGYRSLSGTSMSCPQGAGAAVLMEEATRELIGRDLAPPGDDRGAGDPLAEDISEARHLMRSYAEDLGSSGPDNDYGWGFLNLDGVYQDILERGIPVIEATATIDDPVLDCQDGAGTVDLEVKNSGGQVASGTVTVELDGPETATVTEQVSLGTGDSATFDLPVDGSMAPGAYSVSLTFDYSWEDPASGETKSDTATAGTSFEVQRAVVDTARDLPATASVGETFDTTVSITNSGSVPATDVTLVETIPAAYDVVPRVPGPGFSGMWSSPGADEKVTRLNGTTYLTYEIGELKPGETWTTEYTLAAEQPGDHAITSDLSYTDNGLCEEDERHTFTQSVDLLGSPALAIVG